MHYTSHLHPDPSSVLTARLTGAGQAKLLTRLVWRPGLSYKIENSNTQNCNKNVHNKT